VNVLNQAAPGVCIHSDYGNPFKVNAGRETPMDEVIKKITDPYILFESIPEKQVAKTYFLGDR